MKKILNKALSSVLFLIIMACGSSKTPLSQAEMDTLETLINKKNFTIESDWAHPTASMAMQQASRMLGPGNNPSSINLISNSNFLTVSGDSITSSLPYFGERQAGGSYGGGDSTIEFKGLMKNYKVEQKNNSSIDISFEAKSHSENFRVRINVFPNLKTDMMLSGNTRTVIRYTGELSPVSEEKETVKK
ncbi:DUF4251 domain-containing protein [Tamlana sp. 2_MG-2023]|uniref:DUF4251 domain-containing protein n=1 Tax=unclassified Tamlana TaxID=2614803 RepID=UPI0026E45346|nr:MULTISPECIES: DUF4251 domain-containing protein [unclassified Tamlana]MDO6759480.1 DUF4251 domain-containing protein [Tamlana sp. 2_MG-2023]MDO6790381.1 DUF4251 domain-containing protein [Tamlana sp. 1_MG-2023]